MSVIELIEVQNDVKLRFYQKVAVLPGYLLQKRSRLEPFFAEEMLIPPIEVLEEVVSGQGQMALTGILKHFILEKSVDYSLVF